MAKLAAALAIALALAPYPSFAKTHRSAAARAEFMHQNPCPSTGKQRGKCPGYIVDHVTPLCANGADDPSNMQWQTVADAKSKDRIERRECALGHREGAAK